MVSNIIYRLSLFGDYSQLGYSKENVVKILTSFDKALMFTIFPEITSDGNTTQRIQFNAPDQSEIIKIGLYRIDLQFASNKKEGYSDEEIDLIKGEFVSYYDKLMNIFGEGMGQANRLAWYTTYIYFETDEQERKEYKARFNKELPFFSQNTLEDMITRYGAWRNASICGSEERINVVATISRYKATFGIDNEADGHMIEYDINTWQGNKNNRFGIEEIKEFEDNAINIQKELDKEVLP